MRQHLRRLARGHLAVVVEDAEHARFKREGVPATAPKDSRPGGETLARCFLATDPDGYETEVIQRGRRFG